MQYRSDRYGNKISVLGYGCMRFSQKGGKIDIEKAEQEIMAAYAYGCKNMGSFERTRQ